MRIRSRAPPGSRVAWRGWPRKWPVLASRYARCKLARGHSRDRVLLRHLELGQRPRCDALFDVWPRKPAWVVVLPELWQLTGPRIRAGSYPDSVRSRRVAHHLWDMS